MKITAAEVNKLRKSTGAGMMDCKKALVEAEGDFNKAIENLRKKGQKVAANRADRVSSEGAVLAKVNSENTKGIIISINCETDFVAKNESYLRLANELADNALNYESLDSFLESEFSHHEWWAIRGVHSHVDVLCVYQTCYIIASCIPRGGLGTGGAL